MTEPHNTITAETLAEFADAWNRHDIEALMSFMHDDCLFHAVAGPDLLGRTFSGRDEVREGFKAAWTNFPDAAWLDGNHFVVGDRGVSECTFKGTKADNVKLHDDKSTYTGVYAKGGPSVSDNDKVKDLSNLCNRGEADVRGTNKR